jgi:YHS domain-containing protein
MLRMLIWILIGYVVYRLIRGRGPKEVEPTQRKEEAAETFKDPVCGVYVSREDAVIGNLEGERVHFCSMECLERFRDQLPNK